MEARWRFAASVCVRSAQTELPEQTLHRLRGRPCGGVRRYWDPINIVVAPGLLVMQAVARCGNFFNQELDGPPTNLPWGIAIQCANRIPAYVCPAGSDPTATLGQHFQPLFLYESISGLVGAVVLLAIARRFGSRLRRGDVGMLLFILCASTRFLLELLRADNWTFFGVPTAMIVSATVVVAAVIVLVIRHRPGAGPAPIAAESG
jgi:phosphatidylglycerol---prolipoprotein diacylglyceryl transferase